MTSESDELTPKPWWLSRAVVGSLIAFIAGIAALLGWELDVNLTTNFVLGVIAVASNGVAVWGSVKRKVPIDQKQVLPGVRRAGPDDELREPARQVRPAPVPTNTERPEPSNPFLE